ncbi:MAG: dihydroorotate dehydrogenase electron transfer subunit [Lachnospiraceae bacterium]|nr:dihydroorotate dehydrogenase electron transfer subunit [Lachnospiraceae bacterium]
MAKLQCMAKITAVTEIAEGIFSMWLLVPEIASQAVSGQFISLYCENKDTLLPRPISLCEINREEGTLRIVFRVVGAGTLEFSQKNAGEEIRVLGPLGNGFPVSECQTGKKAVLIGGGIGIPPLLQLSKEIPGEVTVVLGYRNADTFLLQELEKAAQRVVVATEDGSIGTKGNVIDAIRGEKIQGDVIYSCGPTPMLRGVKAWGLEENVPAWLSLEEKMACGIGACLACVCQSTDVDNHSKVHNKRICKDGPVFLSTEIEL